MSSIGTVILAAIVLLGPPGGGKGTQAKMLVEKDPKAAVQISTGDLLRQEVQEGTELGKKIDPLMKEGKYVPDEIVNALLKKELQKQLIAGKKKIIFDGYPRTLTQAIELDKLLAEKNIKLSQVVLINVTDGVLIKRISGRYQCNTCKAIYNDQGDPANMVKTCPKCNGTTFIRRQDDQPNAILERLKVYKTTLGPVFDYYKKKGVFCESKGDGNPQEVSLEIKKCLQ